MHTSVSFNHHTSNAICDFESDTWSSDWLITCQWSNASDDETVMAWSTALLEKIHATNLESFKGQSHIYMNDASDSQKPFDGFPAANLAKLKAIRQTYDPTLVFRNLSTGGYKLD
jgi:hypothetical protein